MPREGQDAFFSRPCPRLLEGAVVAFHFLHAVLVGIPVVDVGGVGQQFKAQQSGLLAGHFLNAAEFFHAPGLGVLPGQDAMPCQLTQIGHQFVHAGLRVGIGGGGDPVHGYASLPIQCRTGAKSFCLAVTVRVLGSPGHSSKSFSA